MLIDTHAHLNFKAFRKDLPHVIRRAAKTGVTKIIIPGAALDSSAKAVKIAQTYPGCFAAVGIHPHHLAEFLDLRVDKVNEQLKKIAIKSKVCAIGEIGLDYHQYKGYPPVSLFLKKAQKELFLTQLQLAQENNLPVIIHCRKAHDDLLAHLSSFLSSQTKNLTGVFHCFSGEEKHLKEILTLGFYLGFDGNITYPENENLGLLVKYTPLASLLLETDSPFLSPMPRRDKRNEPSFLPLIAKIVAEIKQKEIWEIAKITSGNASQLFRI